MLKIAEKVQAKHHDTSLHFKIYRAEDASLHVYARVRMVPITHACVRMHKCQRTITKKRTIVCDPFKEKKAKQQQQQTVRTKNTQHNTPTQRSMITQLSKGT